MSSDGLRLTSRPWGSPWELRLAWTGLGRGQLVEEVVEGATGPTVDGNRAVLSRSAGDEWYLNGPLGLEQGFTLPPRAQSATSDGEELLSLVLTTRGDLAPSLSANGESVVFRDGSGSAVLRYTDLYVQDDEGTPLQSSFEVAPPEIRIVVDDRFAVYPIVIDPLVVLEQRLTPGGGAEGDYMGMAVAIDGDIALVGAHRDGDRGTDAGAAYVFVRGTAEWEQEQKLFAPDAEPNDYFGWSVAVSGATALVGAHHADDGAPNAGAAYAFSRNAGSWTFDGKLTASDPDVSDNLAYAAALEGNYAVLGAPGWEGPVGDGRGAAYVFVRSASSWGEQDQLVASDGADDDQFGSDVDIAGDTVIVGAYLHDETFDGDEGAAYVFRRNGQSWDLEAQLTAADPDPSDYFGISVALSGDRALVGASLDDEAGTNAGAAYSFTRTVTVWSEEGKLTAVPAANQDQFGFSVDLDGTTALVGTPNDDSEGTNAGSAYAFVRSGAGWALEQEIIDGNVAARDAFGRAVALSGDRAIFGAPFHDGTGSDAGAAYVFARNGTWVRDTKVAAQDGKFGDAFGESVTIDGDTAIVGANRTTLLAHQEGAAYVFQRSGTLWTWTQRLVPDPWPTVQAQF
ncbi:MAG: FG-GAP repeat protein, partial [Deltaproteobacteria bacterium]|nr:FG-GAP repeat protein [Deltaproteobacteria bacterium]MBW2537406.1 FG-GAP repeat protein [Deltaproteobacteria bacterium]